MNKKQIIKKQTEQYNPNTTISCNGTIGKYYKIRNKNQSTTITPKTLMMMGMGN